MGQVYFKNFFHLVKSVSRTRSRLARGLTRSLQRQGTDTCNARCSGFKSARNFFSYHTNNAVGDFGVIDPPFDAPRVSLDPIKCCGKTTSRGKEEPIPPHDFRKICLNFDSLNDGGGGGIRTHGTQSAQRFSRPPRSTTPAPHRANGSEISGSSSGRRDPLAGPARLPSAQSEALSTFIRASAARKKRAGPAGPALGRRRCAAITSCSPAVRRRSRRPRTTSRTSCRP